MPLRILFMGTPAFAQVQLQALYTQAARQDWEIVGVVCQPDKPCARGNRTLPCAVKAYAQSLALPILQPQTLRDDAFMRDLSAAAPELIVVAAYGKLLPQQVLTYPRLGCINVHGSLLPHFRGAAPIQRAIMQGEEKTGVTIMYMEQGLDTGAILAQSAFPITLQDTYGTVHDRMAAVGAALLTEVIPSLRDGTARPIPQENDLASYAPKIEKEECRLDFSQSAAMLACKIRALSPAPLAAAFLQTKQGVRRIKIVDARAVETSKTAPFGTVLSACNGSITVRCGNGALELLRLKPDGKAEMDAAAFINGRQIATGDRFMQAEG
ncbi:MAG: methionyl-tRNA formyltransferase [Eubacteriales bacterium]|nr:methionyl-tRNA formyltransferase [Eubacteriales bacterium]